MSNLNVRGFATVAGADKLDGSTDASPNVGGRIDYRQKIDRFNFVVSGTDASARNYESAPKIKDAVITADTHQDGAPPDPSALQRLRRLTCLMSKLHSIARYSAVSVRARCINVSICMSLHCDLSTGVRSPILAVDVVADKALSSRQLVRRL